MDGVEMIAIERQEQIKKHGFDAEHDDDYTTELLNAVLCIVGNVLNQFMTGVFWPWSHEWWERITGHRRKEQLAIAGALIAAEIDRLNRTVQTSDLGAREEEGQDHD